FLVRIAYRHSSRLQRAAHDPRRRARHRGLAQLRRCEDVRDVHARSHRARLSGDAPGLGHHAVCDHRFARPPDPLLSRKAPLAPRSSPHLRVDGRRTADGRGQCAESKARSAAGAVARAVSDRDHRNDHRAHVDRVGGARCVGGHSGGRWESDRRRTRLCGHGNQLARASRVRIPGIAAARHRRDATRRPLYRLSLARVAPIQRRASGGAAVRLSFGRARQLADEGVLGLNKRNGDYILRFNARSRYPLVDDKLRTKQLALAANLAVPPLYGVIRTHHDIRLLPEIVRDHPQFVLKPAHGSGGDGIVVIAGRSGSRYRTISGALLDAGELAHYLSNAINGQFSLGGIQDVVIVEYMVKFSPVFESLSYQGVPDVRIIVFRGYPIMAMVRLPTRISGGKANLHQGAVGAGIDLSSGRTLDGVLGTEVITHHPDTTNPIAGVQVPAWDTIL